MDDFENEIKKSFLEESEQLLEEAEGAFMSLDEGQNTPEIINKIFRAAHSFKGGARAVGFNQLADVGHKLEDVIALIKNGTLQPSKNVCTVLLEALDVLKLFLAGLRSDFSFTYDASAIEEKLKNIHTSKDTTTPEQNLSKETVHDLTTHTENTKLQVSTKAAPSSGIASKNTEDDGIRVGLKKLDLLLNIVGELVVNQSMLSQHKNQKTLDSEKATQVLSYMEKLVAEIQDISLSLRMVPIKPLFQKMKRTVRDVATSLEKEIDFVSEGEDVELDKTILDKIVDPITHMIRNACDHGLENPPDRMLIGKPTTGTVHFKASILEDKIQLSIRDDGKGLNAKKLIQKAIEKGVLKNGDSMSEQDAFQLIFAPGFSTKEKVTDFSGRGVGMDVVRRSIEDLKGSIQIKSEIDKGSEFIINLPLSLSIISGMVILVDEQKYVVPVTQLVETIEYRKYKVETLTGKGRMLNLRNEVMPILSLSHLLHPKKSAKADREGLGLVTIFANKKVSFEIDQILGQQQIVIKKLGEEVQNIPGIIAGAILADGEPGLVINLHDFIKNQSKGTTHVAA